MPFILSCVRKQPIIALYFESENELKFITSRPGINRLFAYCKAGNLNIHIWVLFGYTISSAKQEKSGSI